jgi:glycosyltransferase involved in cell wall biosynthesis
VHILIVPQAYPTAYDLVRGTFFQQQAHALKNAGHQVGVVVPQHRSLRHLRSKFFGWPKGFTYHEEEGIPVYQHYNWAWFSQVKTLHRKFWVRAGLVLFEKYIADWGKPDIIHAHVAWLAGDLALDIKRRYDIPYILTEHNTAYARGLLTRQQKIWAQSVFQYANARVVVSPELGKLVASQLGDEVVCPWHWVPNVVESRFQPASKPKDKTGYRFLNVALMTDKKGQKDLLRAFAEHFRGNSDVQLRLGGDGPLRVPLQRLSEELGITDQVLFLGMLSRDEVVREMQSCDAFILPSHYETFGVVLIEALACGKPVIATACGGPESIVHAQNGLLIPPKDVDALGRALVKMYKNSVNYALEEIRQDCVARFGEQAVIDQLEDLYKDVLGLQ